MIVPFGLATWEAHSCYWIRTIFSLRENARCVVDFPQGIHWRKRFVKKIDLEKKLPCGQTLNQNKPSSHANISYVTVEIVSKFCQCLSPLKQDHLIKFSIYRISQTMSPLNGFQRPTLPYILPAITSIQYIPLKCRFCPRCKSLSSIYIPKCL